LAHQLVCAAGAASRYELTACFVGKSVSLSVLVWQQTRVRKPANMLKIDRKLIVSALRLFTTGCRIVNDRSTRICAAISPSEHRDRFYDPIKTRPKEKYVMASKILAVAAAALAVSAGAASAQIANTTRQADAGLFDQGGVFYRGPAETSTTTARPAYDTNPTASIEQQPRHIRSATDNPTGIPSDTRNERGLGLFDRVSQ
jgi:hypothetical protein